MAATGGVKMMTSDMGIEFLRAIPRQFINENRKMAKSTYSIFMRKIDTKEFLLEWTEMGGFGDFPVRDEGDGLTYARPDVGGKVRMQPDQRQLAFIITERDRRFNKIDKVERASKMLMQAAQRTTERIAAYPWNFAFDSATLGTDGVSLCSLAHVRLNGMVVANTPATQTDFNMQALEAALIVFRTTPGSDGTVIELIPRYVLHHPQEGPNVRRVLKTSNYFTGAASGTTGAGVPSNTPNAADTGVTNEYIRQFELVPVESVYLTDPDMWFLICAPTDHEVVLVENEKIHDRAFTHPFTEDYIYSLQFSQTSGFATDQGVYGSSGQ